MENFALLGPAYTLVNTGSLSYAGLSYGSDLAYEKVTGKTPSESLSNLIKSKKKTNKKRNYDDFFTLVKNRIKKTHKIINSTN